MKLIIAPTDFSPLADNSVRYGIEMARAMGANLMLVNVFQLPISYSEVPLVNISLDEIRKISEDKLAELKQNIKTITGNNIQVYTESRLGDVTDELQKLSNILHPYAIVMGTRGVTGVGRFFLGSNTLSVIKHLGVPVFIIPPGATFKPFKKVGLSSDLREVVDSTPVEHIRSLVSFFNADLHVLNVDYKQQHFTPYTPEEIMNLESMLSGLNPVFDFIENKEVDEGISEFAEKNNIDLIITLPKKHSVLERLFEKSTTRELIHQTKIPMMCIHQEVHEEVAKTQPS